MLYPECPAPPPPQSLPQAQEKGFLQVLGADDMPGPGLMLGAWCQVGNDHLYSLQFLILGRDRAHLIGDLVAFHWNIFPFHTAGEKERSSELRRWHHPESAYLVSLSSSVRIPSTRVKELALHHGRGCNTAPLLLAGLWGERLCLPLAEAEWMSGCQHVPLASDSVPSSGLKSGWTGCSGKEQSLDRSSS